MKKTVVLGLGNLLLRDEGFGVQAVARLRDRYAFSEDVELVDGGTLGLALLPTLEEADRIIVLDAVDLGATPGTLVHLGWDDIPRALQTKISPHQDTLAEALALLELRRGRPGAFELVGVQPATLDDGLELSDSVERSLEVALLDVLETLAIWGHRAERREDPTHRSTDFPAPTQRAE